MNQYAEDQQRNLRGRHIEFKVQPLGLRALTRGSLKAERDWCQEKFRERSRTRENRVDCASFQNGNIISKSSSDQNGVESKNLF